MPWKNQSFWEWLLQNSEAIWAWLIQHGEIVVGFFLAVVLAIFRTTRAYGKADWVEALICGFLTLAGASLLEWLKFPSQIAIAVGGVIGFKGSKWANEFIDKKLQLEDDPSK